jgi:hypothetical protein
VAVDLSAFLGGYRKEGGSLLVHMLAAALRALDLALFIFRKRQDDLERLLAVFAVKLIAGHGDLRVSLMGMVL